MIPKCCFNLYGAGTRSKCSKLIEKFALYQNFKIYSRTIDGLF